MCKKCLENKWSKALFEARLRKELSMDYEVAADLRAYYEAKRKAENRKVRRFVWFIVDIALMGGVLYLIATNPYKP